MAGDLLTLHKRMHAKADSVRDRANEAKKHVVVELARDLAFSTPVDESTALSNWQVGLGAPVPGSAARAAYFVGKAGSTQSSSAGAMIAAVEAAVANAIPGQPIYLSNAVPYIVRLDQGWSRQAPRGFTYRVPIVGRLAMESFSFFDK